MVWSILPHKHYQSRDILGKLLSHLGQNIFSAAKLASNLLLQESGISDGYPFSMSSCCILFSSEPNLVLEQIISAK